jgi:hypothetical protein
MVSNLHKVFLVDGVARIVTDYAFTLDALLLILPQITLISGDQLDFDIKIATIIL